LKRFMSFSFEKKCFVSDNMDVSEALWVW
jgi:hypothetical protein